MAETVTLPKLGFDMREGTFLNWVKKVGEQVNKGEVLAEIESDKATIEVESPLSGVLLSTLVKEGDVVPVDAPIATIGAAGESGGAAPAPAAQPAAAPAPAAQQSQPAPQADPEEEFLPDGVRASPIARRIAEERKIDLRQVRGTGPKGRITREDVENYQAPAAAAPTPATQPPAPAPTQKALAPVATGLSVAPHPVPPVLGPGMSEVPLSRLRQRIATRLVESKLTTPHFYITTEIEMDAALATRKQVNESLDDAHKITVNDLIVKAAALALRQYPNLNSHYYGDKVIKYDYINIGIAVALDAGGLMNVVTKNADTTAISVMAARNKEMIAAARSGKGVKPEYMEGSTFTTSNLGPYEVEQFVAIINPPEAGIIAVGSAKAIPVVVNGEIKVVTRMKATISADHRVTDGAEAAQFMQTFKKLLETPIRIIV